MKAWSKKPGLLARSWKWLLLLLAVVAVVWYIGAALDKVDDAQTAEGQRVLEDSLRAAAVNSYVSFGRYPATLEELTEHYGIAIDNERYAVYYEIFADNIMPEITAVLLQPEGGGGR